MCFLLLEFSKRNKSLQGSLCLQQNLQQGNPFKSDSFLKSGGIQYVFKKGVLRG